MSGSVTQPGYVGQIVPGADTIHPTQAVIIVGGVTMAQTLTDGRTMSNFDFQIKRGDRRQPIEAYLRDGAGTSINLTDATVRFHMVMDGNNVPKINSPAIIVNPAIGHVRYEWTLADTDTPGTYNAEWQVTFADGTILTFPNNGHLLINVYPDLA